MLENIVVLSLEDIMALCQQPILGGDVGENNLLITHTFEFFIERIIQGGGQSKEMGRQNCWEVIF